MIAEFLNLPGTITYEGISFMLTFLNDSGEGKLAYDIMFADDNSIHADTVNTNSCWYNPWQEGYAGFLWYQGGIQNDEDMGVAMGKLRTFLATNQFI